MSKEEEEEARPADAVENSPTTISVIAPSPSPRRDGKLHGSWTFWFDNPRIATEWKDTLKRLATFETVGDFWGVYNNVRCPSDLAVNSNYSLFRNGIEPTWEDPLNTDGGKFVFTIPKKDSKKGKTDEWWMFTMLAVIGETMDSTGDQVNGAVVSIRKNQDRIALWLKSRQRRVCTQVGERWKKALHLDDKMTLRYQTHSDAAASGHSFRNEVHFEV